MLLHIVAQEGTTTAGSVLGPTGIQNTHSPWALLQSGRADQVSPPGLETPLLPGDGGEADSKVTSQLANQD